MKWLAMIYNYPYGFFKLKKDLKKLGLSKDELDNIEWILITEGEIQ